MSSAEGYRLVWYHSTRKAQIDAAARMRQVERALEDLAELEQKLGSPRSRYHHRAKVAEAVETILQDRGTMRWISTEINERIQETYRQERRGRPQRKDASRETSEHAIRTEVCRRPCCLGGGTTR